MEPCVCSKECSDDVFNHIGKTMEDRRISAGIALWKERQTEVEAIADLKIELEARE